MSCNLKAYGDKFDVKKFVARTRLMRGSDHVKGEPRPFKSKVFGSRYKTSGIVLQISNADWGNFPGQVRGAIKFLKKNQRSLEQLASFDGVEEILLDFGVLIGPKPGYVTAHYLIPNELLTLAARLKIQIGISHYPFKPRVKPTKMKSK